jgi:hypothetical protein
LWRADSLSTFNLRVKSSTTMEPAMLQQLPVGLDPLNQQQFEQFQQAQRSQHRQPSRASSIPISALPPQYHDLRHASNRLTFYSNLTPVTPLGPGNAFTQQPLSAVSTVPPTFVSQPALSQPHQVIYSNAYGGLQPQQTAFPARVQQAPASVLGPLPTPVPAQQPPPAPRETKGRPAARDAVQVNEDGTFSSSSFEGLKLIHNPPNLAEWRQRLFDVDMLIVLTEDEYTPSLHMRSPPTDMF